MTVRYEWLPEDACIADVIEHELRLALGLEVSFARPLCAPLGTSW